MSEVKETKMSKEEVKIEYPGTSPLINPEEGAMKKYKKIADENKQKLKEIQEDTVLNRIPEKVRKKFGNVLNKVAKGGLLTVAGLSLAACKQAPEVQIEEQVEEQQEEEKGEITIPSETKNETPPVVKEQEKEEISPKAEETQAEFNESMIKNRFIFSERVISGEPWIAPRAPVPLWYVQDWSNGRGHEFMVSGVVAGPLRKGVGATGKEELLLPVAFKKPGTEEFFVRNISFGTDEYLQVKDELGGFGVVFLDNYSYTLAGGEEGYTATVEPFEKIKENIQEGDQIAFTLINEWDVQAWGPIPLEEIEKDNKIKIMYTLISGYFQNNKTVYEAMKENKDLPELVINPNMIIVNKIGKDNNK